MAEGFFTAVVDQARIQGLLSDEHFTVDGTLIEAWASHKSFQRKDARPKTPPDDPGNPSVDFHGERRSNDTHLSTTDPEARLARKGAGKEAKLSYAGHVLMENRNGIAVQGCVTQATGRAEYRAASVAKQKYYPNPRSRCLACSCRLSSVRVFEGASRFCARLSVSDCHRNRNDRLRIL